MNAIKSNLIRPTITLLSLFQEKGADTKTLALFYRLILREVCHVLRLRGLVNAVYRQFAFTNSL